MGIFSKLFSNNKSLNENDENAEIKNQILSQSNYNSKADSYLNDMSAYKYNVETIPSANIDMSMAMGMDNPNFWNHHQNTKEDYINLAERLPDVQEELNSGKSIDEIKANPELHDCVAAYYDPDKMVRVRENENGIYEFEDEGRHRVAAAKELGYDMPIQNLNKPVPEKNFEDYLGDTYSLNNNSNDAFFEDEILNVDNNNDISDGNNYMSEDEDVGYSPYKSYDRDGNTFDADREEECFEIPDENNGALPENEQNEDMFNQEEPENLDFDEENTRSNSEENNGVLPENEQNEDIFNQEVLENSGFDNNLSDEEQTADSGFQNSQQELIEKENAFEDASMSI